MTYNFDPDRWYDNEFEAIRSALEAGKISGEEYERAVEKLDRKYDDIWTRLDGSYQIPKGRRI